VQKACSFVVQGLAGLALFVGAQGAQGQEQPATTADTSLSQVVVIGSRLQSSGPPDTGPLPVEVIGSDQIAVIAPQSTDELLHNEPSLSGFASGDNNGNKDSYLEYSQLNLWGLGPQYTLVLLNGVRFEADAPANYAVIPPAAVDHIEILKAGAGALYGSDAVAGVVNIVTKKDADATQLSASYGQAYSGRAPITTVDFSTGGSSDAGHFFISASYYNRDPLDELDRNVLASNDFTHLGWIDLRSSFTDPANFTLPGGTSPITLNTALVPNGSIPTSAADFRAYNPATDASDRPQAGVSGISALQRESFYLGATRPLNSGGAELFVDGIYANERTTVEGGSETFDFSTIGGIPATNPWNVFHVNITSPFLWRPLDIGGPDPETSTGLTGDRVIVNRETGRLNIGLRGDLGRFKTDVSVGYFALNIDQQDPTSISVPALTAGIDSTAANAFNPFCVCNTAAQYAGIKVTSDEETRYRSPSINANVTGPLFALPMGEIQLAAGAEYRRESISVSADPLSEAGEIMDEAAIAPFDLHRTETTAYSEFGVPLVAGEAPSDPARLELGLAVRFEHYSDFGNATKPLFSLRWAAIPSQLMFRASLSDSFRAPFLEQITASPTSVTTTLERNGVFINAIEITSGNPNLKAETARTLSGGAVFSPTALPGLRVSLDVLDVKQKNVIISPDPQLVLNGTQPGTVVNDGPNQVTVYTPLANIASRTMQSASLNIGYAANLPGRWSTHVNWETTYLYKLLADIGDGTGTNEYASRYSQTFGGLPKFRSNLTALATNQGLSIGSQINYVGNYRDDYVYWSYDNVTVPPVIPIWITADLMAKYDFGQAAFISDSFWHNVALDAGIKNIFNKQAPFVAGATGYDYGVANLYGRFFHAGITARF